MDISSNGYIPFNEGKRTNFISTIKFEGAYSLAMANKFLVNKISIFFRKIFNKSHATGFDTSAFKNWKISKKSLGIGSGHLLTPYEMARTLGFSKTAHEIKKELDRVPTRVIRGYKYKGEKEGSSKTFLKQLGLLNQKGESLLKSTPLTKALELDAGVSAGYSIGTHSMMVLRMYDEHLMDHFLSKDKFKEVVPLAEFRLFLMLHDIGKGLAVEEEGLFETPERKRKELQYCQDAIDIFVDKKILKANTGKIFKALLSDVTLGKYLKGKISLKEANQEIKKAIKDHALDSLIDPARFFSLCKIFHIADAGAYKNLRRINGLFEVSLNGRRVRHAKVTGNEQNRAGLKLKKLKMSLITRKDNNILPS